MPSERKPRRNVAQLLADRAAERATEKADRTAKSERARKRRQRTNVRVNADERVMRYWKSLQRSRAQIQARTPAWARIDTNALHFSKEIDLHKHLRKAYGEAAGCASHAHDALSVELNAAKHRGDEVAVKRIARAVERNGKYLYRFNQEKERAEIAIAHIERMEAWADRVGVEREELPRTDIYLIRDEAAAYKAAKRVEDEAVRAKRLPTTRRARRAA
jgi:hypothetical protein